MSQLFLFLCCDGYVFMLLVWCIHMSHLFTIKSCELLHIAIKEADILSTHTTDLTCSCKRSWYIVYTYYRSNLFLHNTQLFLFLCCDGYVFMLLVWRQCKLLSSEYWTIEFNGFYAPVSRRAVLCDWVWREILTFCLLECHVHTYESSIHN
jgi:hypothetical protein